MKKILFLVVLLILTISACSLAPGENKTVVPANDQADNQGTSDTKPKREPFTVLDPIPEAEIENKLDLSRQGLTKADLSIFDKTDLVELDLSFNDLSGALPSQIGNLRNLKILNASNNKMTGVPAEIGQLANLEVLDLSNNQLTGLPNELANLKNLKTLNLSGNQYSEQDLAVIRNSLSNVEYILK